MRQFDSRIDSQGPGFAQNRADMLALIDRMRALEARTVAKSEERRAVFDKRGLRVQGVSSGADRGSCAGHPRDRCSSR